MVLFIMCCVTRLLLFESVEVNIKNWSGGGGDISVVLHVSCATYKMVLRMYLWMIPENVTMHLKAIKQ